MLSFALGIPQRVRAWEIPAACPPHHRGSRFPRCGKWSPRESRCYRRSRHESRRSHASSRLVRRALGAAFSKRPPPAAVPASYRAGDRRRPAFRGRAPMKGALLTTAGRSTEEIQDRGGGGVGFALPTIATLQLRPMFTCRHGLAAASTVEGFVDLPLPPSDECPKVDANPDTPTPGIGVKKQACSEPMRT
jgi:hypothetical protein